MTKSHDVPKRQPTYVATLATDEVLARRISDRLIECLDPAEAVCAAFEQPGGGWEVAVHFGQEPDVAILREMVAAASNDRLARSMTVDKLPARDWVKASLEGLPPVGAGRFWVHGAHHRPSLPSRCIGIEIEAATAFGTGHHATTRGCLIALDGLAHRRFRHVLDIGTGSGVLAIAAAKRLHVRVLATEIDRQSARVARDNARLNGVATLIETVHAAGLNAPQVLARAPFDLVLANILLKPLQRLAAPIARSLWPDARVVLSGVLATQADATVSAYRSQGLMLERRIAIEEWVTLVLVAASRR